MNQESRGLLDWLSWRPPTTAATATTATDAKTVATVATVAVAAGQRSYLWRITEPGRAREVMVSGNPTLAEVRMWYPRALVEPITPEQGTFRAQVECRSETDVRQYLASVGETDSLVIEEILAEFRLLTRR
jgi:hypothetical protein